MAAAVLALALAATPAWADGKRQSDPPPGRVAFQSLALPGWGQIQNGSALKAVGFFGVYAGFVGWGIAINQDKQDAQGELNRALGTSEETTWQLEVDRLGDERNGKYWFAGLTAILSMADAYVDASLKHFDERIDADLTWWSETEREPVVGLRVQLEMGRGAAADR